VFLRLLRGEKPAAQGYDPNGGKTESGARQCREAVVRCFVAGSRGAPGSIMVYDRTKLRSFHGD
jgi:hypothetical protein